MIERLILVGLITSTKFLQQVRPVWDNRLMGSVTVQRIAGWCVDYFDEYHKAPGITIEDIAHAKLRTGEIPKDMHKDIDEFLDELDEEYTDEYNLQYALDQANTYLKERHLELHNEKVKDLLESGEADDAHALASSYKGLSFEIANDLDLSEGNVSLRIKNAFTGLLAPLFKFPGALGRFMNSQLVRGGFISFMASEKRGKSFWLLEMAIKAVTAKCKVAFFQAGDMTEDQQLRRLAIYLTKTPINEKYIGDVFVPVSDCIHNQLHNCDREERTCDFGALIGAENIDEETIREELTLDHLLDAYEENGTDYTPCNHCAEFKTKPWGSPWIELETIKHPLSAEKAARKAVEFFVKKKRRMRISTHANGSLSVLGIQQTLDRWRNTSGFIPDVIIIDYADLLVPSKVTEFRHQQNEIWKDLRGLSQTTNSLVITATQADAKSYDQNTLKQSNFSEDKRKYAHVTAMYGLNRDKYGREKKLGLLRINALVIREDEFDVASEVTVLQSLSLGRPFLDSYF